MDDETSRFNRFLALLRIRSMGLPARRRPAEYSDTHLLNWLERNPIETLQAVEWQLDNGKARTVREAIRHHLRRGL